MRKNIKRKHVQAELLTLPDAENAKWLGLGFLVSIILVGVVFFLLIQARIH